jgi:hypothetical protein
MKLVNIKIYLFIFIIYTISCCKPSKNYYYSIDKEHFVTFKLGDINKDNSPDFAKVLEPEMYFDKKDGFFDHCKDNKCQNVISFTNGFPSIILKESLYTTVEPTFDLNKDGIKELLIARSWWIGSHIKLSIYSFNKQTNTWNILSENVRFMENSYTQFVKPLDNHRFLFNSSYYDTLLEDYSSKWDTIYLKK